LVASGASDGTLIVRSIKDNEIILKDRQIKAGVTQTLFSPTS